MKKLLFLLLVTFSGYAQQKINLGGNWEFRSEDSVKWYPATVPGSVHTDLMANKQLADPFYRDNEEKVQWVEKKDWYYRKTFSFDSLAWTKYDEISLLFEGLDTYAQVYLNGKQVSFTDNMFVEWELPCRKFLRNGNNTLEVRFLSPVRANVLRWEKEEYKMPAINDVSEKQVSSYVRKAPYHFGWDWGPRLVTSGIFRPVYLTGQETIGRPVVNVSTPTVSKEKAELKVKLDIKTYKTSEVLVAATLSPGQYAKGKPVTISQSVLLLKGSNTTAISLQIPTPSLWYPFEIGKPALYDLEINITAKDGKSLYRSSRQIGLRKIELVNEKDAAGRSFYLKVNGIPLFLKGANYIPQDNFLPNVDSTRYERVIRSAKEANMNVLRVWGGGFYENDLLYTLCDREGIVIWQDFMFACSMYPSDNEFIQTLTKEFTYNILRLKHHPSIALWCGNNEIEQGWYDGWIENRKNEKGAHPADSAALWEGYKKIFYGLLPRTIAELDSGRPYHSSSPSTGDPAVKTNTKGYGDRHDWTIWFGLRKFENYEKTVSRFVSEFGYQSFPDFHTVSRFTVPADHEIESPVMQVHQKHIGGNPKMRRYMDLYYKIPTDFREFLYMSQVVHADAMRIGTEAHRRNKPYCMGSIYWQIDDCWPVASWSSTDYYGRWKAPHYAVKRSFATQMITLSQRNDTILLHAVSESLVPLKAKWEVQLLGLDGTVKKTISGQFTLGRDSSKLLLLEKQGTLLASVHGATIENTLLRAKLIIDGKPVSYSRLFLKEPKFLSLPRPTVKTQWVKKGNETLLEVKTDKPALMLYIDLEELDGQFSDNYIDLFPGETVYLKYKGAPQDLNSIRKDKIRLHCLQYLHP